MVKSLAFVVLGVTGQQEDAGSLLQVQKHNQEIDQNRTESVVGPDVTVAKPGYTKLGAGKCKGPGHTDMGIYNDGQGTRGYWYKHKQGTTCAQLCTDMGYKCGGYSVSNHDNCLLWANLDQVPLQASGRQNWGISYCFVKDPMPNPYGCQLAEDVCEPQPGYKRLGLGKCKGPGGADMSTYTDLSKGVRGYWYLHGKGKQCADTCDGMDTCGGYSVSKYNNCLLWANLEEATLEASNRKDWGNTESYCFVKDPMPQPVTEPPPTQPPTTVPPPEPEDPEEPIEPPSEFPAVGYRCPWDSKHRIEPPHDDVSLAECKTLCGLEEDCAYYSYTDDHAGLNAPDLKGIKRCVLCKASVAEDAAWGKADWFTTYQNFKETVKRYEGEEDVCPTGWEGVRSAEECEEIANMGILTVPNGEGKPRLKGWWAREDSQQNRPSGCYIRNSDRSIHGVDSDRGDKNHGRIIWNNHATGKKNKWSEVICVEKACR